MPSINLEVDKLLKWLTASLIAIVLTGMGAYGKWVTDKVMNHEISIAMIISNQEIINAKLDVLLQTQGAIYNGPVFKPKEIILK